MTSSSKRDKALWMCYHGGKEVILSTILISTVVNKNFGKYIFQRGKTIVLLLDEFIYKCN